MSPLGWAGLAGLGAAAATLLGLTAGLDLRDYLRSRHASRTEPNDHTLVPN